MLFNVSLSSRIIFWILALQFMISVSLPFTHATPVSDLAELPGSVENDLAPPQDESDEVLKYLSKRSPGITGNGWFIRTKSNGDKIFGFGPDVGSKHLPSTQQGKVTLKPSRLGSGGFGTVSAASLFEFDRSISRMNPDPEACGWDMPNVVVKRAKRDDSFFGGVVQHKLRAGGFVPKVYKDLWLPESGESLVVMEKMASDAADLVSSYPRALQKHRRWTTKFNRLQMMIDLVDGLAYAHSMKYIHMDVKLENLMQAMPTQATTTYRFKVIDWDLATDLTVRQRSWPAKGTILFMAPEVVRQEYYKWPYKPDVYSAGLCLLYAIKPKLMKNQYNNNIVRLHNRYRTRSEVESYLWTEGLFSKSQIQNHPEVFRLLKRVLCEPATRLTMRQFGAELLAVRNIAMYHGNLPMFT